MSNLARLLLPLALLLLLSLPPPDPRIQLEHLPEPGPIVQVIPSLADLEALGEPEEDMEKDIPPPDRHIIEEG